MSAGVTSRITKDSGGIGADGIGTDLRKPRVAAGLGQRAHPADLCLALDYADHAARVHQVEQMARLDALLIGGQRQVLAQQGVAFRLRILEMGFELVGVRRLEL